jgi:hypothetical protein
VPWAAFLVDLLGAATRPRDAVGHLMDRRQRSEIG